MLVITGLRDEGAGYRNEGGGLAISIEGFRRGSQTEKLRIARQAIAAYERDNYLRISCHGIAEPVLVRIPAAAETFFALPLDRKLRSLAHTGLGYLPSPDSMGLPVDRNPNTMHEQFIVHLDESRTPWPEIDDFRQASIAFCCEAERLCRTITKMLVVGLGVDPEGIVEPPDARNSSFLKYIRWERPGEGVRISDFRLAPHYDNAAVSVLKTPPCANGLQVLTGRGWEETYAASGELIVLFGEQMTRWTNGRIRPGWHQVVNHNDAHEGDGARLSACYFYNPAPMVDDVERYLAGRAKYCAACDASLRGEKVLKQTWTRRFRLNSA